MLPPLPPGVVAAGVVTGVEDPLGVVTFLGGGTIMLLLGLGVVTTAELEWLLVGVTGAGVVKLDSCEETVCI